MNNLPVHFAFQLHVRFTTCLQLHLHFPLSTFWDQLLHSAVSMKLAYSLYVIDISMFYSDNTIMIALFLYHTSACYLFTKYLKVSLYFCSVTHYVKIILKHNIFSEIDNNVTKFYLIQFQV